MTAEGHNKTVAILHLVYGALNTLILLACFGLLLLVASLERGALGSVELVVISFILALFFLLILPSFIAGYGLLKRRRWARTASIVASILAVINFPHGTALGGYSFWFFFGEHGRRLYEKAGLQPRMYGSLYDTAPSPPLDWRTPTQTQEGQPSYVSPPNWRDQ